MGPAGRESERARPDGSTRLRLVDLATSSGTFPLGGGLACILTPTSERSRIASEIAAAVIGPRSTDVNGTMEIAGRYVALQSLPSPLLGPSAAPTVGRALLEEVWRSACTDQRAELESEHAARRLERHRTEAALERVRQRAVVLANRLAPPEPPAPVVVPDPTPDPMVEITPKLESVLDELMRLEPVASPVACALADEFDAVGERIEQAAAEAKAAMEDPELAVLVDAVAAARYAAAHNAGGVAPDARARIEACHRDVVIAESAMFEAKRKDRSGALAAYQAALAAEHVALADAGADSYAAFLVAIAQGAPRVEPEVRLRAELDLAEAEAALSAARSARGLDDRGNPADAELELRARAAQILMRFPGNDPAGELREVRIEHPDADVLRDELRDLMARVDAFPTGDVVAAAIDLLQAHALESMVKPSAESLAARRDDDAVRLNDVNAEIAEEQLALHNETVQLTRACDDHDRILGGLETALAEVDRIGSCDLTDIDHTFVPVLVDALLDAYRAGDLLAGRLPLVVNGAFDGLDASALAAKLALVDDVQVVVVTPDAVLADELGRAGAALVVCDSTPALAAPRADAPAEPLPVSGPCVRHDDKPATTECSQCGRPSCMDCLVYVPGAPELWCVSCADAMRTRNLRLLRRRGA